MSDIEYLFDEQDLECDETRRLERHKQYKLNVLSQLGIIISNDDKRRILNAKTIPEVDRLGRDFIKYNDTTYKCNRKFVYVGVK